MRTIWIIAQNTLLRNVRDIKTMVLFTLLPLIMIVMLGNALDKDYTPHQMPKVKAVYFIEDAGNIGSALDSFLQTDTIKDLLDLERATSVDQGMREVADGKREAFIYLPHVDPAASSKTAIQVYSNKELSLVRSLIDSFVRTTNTVVATQQISGVTKTTMQETVQQTTQQTTPQTSQPATHSHIIDTSITANGKMPRAIDYYAVAETMLFIMFGSLIASLSLLRDVTSNTMTRFQSGPVKPLHYRFGKAIGNVITLYLLTLFLMAVTRFALHVNWGGNIGLVLLVFFLMDTLFIALGQLLAQVSQNMAINVIITWGGAFVLSMITGGTFRVEPGTVLDTIGHISPSYYAQQAIFNTIYGGSSAQVQSSLLTLALITLCVLVCFTLAGRRRFQ